MEQVCEHISQLKSITQSTDYVCVECIKTGDEWVHLRTCQTCGITLCCDSSPNTHMTKHYHKTLHPVIVSSEEGERWLWCYIDQIIVEY